MTFSRFSVKGRLLVLLALLLPLCAMAQPRQYTLRGYLAVEGGESFHYRMVLTDSAGALSGYTLTYAEEPKATRAAVTATIDRKAGTLSFKETHIVYNRGFYSQATLCLVDATLRYVPSNQGSVLEGAITSHDASNAYCGKGTITFVNDDVLKVLFGAEAKKDTPVVAARPPVRLGPKPRVSRIVVSEQPAPAPQTVQPPAPARITAGAGRAYEWKSDSIVLEVWDGGRIDRDIITILYNGEPVLLRHTLDAAPYRISMPVGIKEVNELTIVAINEGNEPPNTANIMLQDGDTRYPVVAYNDMGKRATITIRKAAP